MANHVHHPFRNLSDLNGEHGNTSNNQTPEPTRKRDLLLAFTLLLILLLAIPLIFLAFVFYSTKHVTFAAFGTRELPVIGHPVNGTYYQSNGSYYPSNDAYFQQVNSYYPSRSSYYTSVSVGSFTLVGSWASTAAQFVLGPFMMLFSFYVAREVALKRENGFDLVSMRHVLHEILRAKPASIWQWCTFTFYSAKLDKTKVYQSVRAVHIAALGLALAGLCSLLIVIGDTWIHLVVQPSIKRQYENSIYPLRTSFNNFNLANTHTYAAGFTTSDFCEPTLSAQISSDGPPPCSLNYTEDGMLNIADNPFVYVTLAAGTTYELSDFAINSPPPNRTDFDTRIVNYVDPGSSLSHSFLFYPYAVFQYDRDFPKIINFGVDFTANTTSIVTQCNSSTVACNLLPQESTSDGTQSIPFSIPFNCSIDFHGDLGQPSSDGIEQILGWDSKFYAKANGSPNTPRLAQMNPFYFYAAAAVNSLSFEDFRSDPQAKDYSVVNAGNGRLAFALSCETTIYDVTYSVIDGSIFEFNATQSSPQKASIIQAPLQEGFGRYNLYQSALLSVLKADQTVAEYMSPIFSQIGMALASGVFTYDFNTQQRIRYDQLVTQIPKAPLWFLVGVCLVYVLMSLAALIAAMVLQRRKDVAKAHAELVPLTRFTLRNSVRNIWESAEDQGAV